MLRCFFAAALIVGLSLRYWLGHAQASEPPAMANTAGNPSTDTVRIDHSIDPDFIKTAVPTSQIVPERIAVSGKLALDKRQLRIAAARVAGRLGRIFVFEGQSVTAGQPLAEIYSPDYVAAEKEYLLAQRFQETLKSDADVELHDDAIATARSAANKLRVLGASNEDIARLQRTGTVAEYLQVRAPIGGVVIQRNVDPGAYLNIGDTLMSLARLDTLWLLANIYENDYAGLKLGQTLDFETPALPGRTFASHVSFIAPTFDPATHTLAIRCDVPNADERLRPEMPITGRLTRGTRTAWVVPHSAVVHVRDTDYVFVQEAAQQFKRVAVQGFGVDASGFAVTQGLSSAAPVVIDGGLLLNQMLGG